ncbi:unnamed protein product [Phytophthora fragariaefolia]|uniref:Unnamed protein product n=1 Tax=Phytophthora fragariaefolia TaxID=1490495 RepID=A0A9W6Y203_9STRA|nr:unnamed protein product [Phytophthora fragariaefolia]
MIACPLVAKAKELSQGAAHAVESADSRDDNSDTDGEGEIWIASGREEPKSPSKPSVNDPRCTWLVDSGATHHMCGDRSILFGVEPTRLVIRVANGERILTSEKGNCIITTLVNKRPKAILLTDVYFAPELSRNLISVHKLVENGLVCDFGSSCTITNSSGDTVGIASSDGSLWKLNSTSSQAEANFAQLREATLQKWHERLGHINAKICFGWLTKNLWTASDCRIGKHNSA